MSRMPVNFQFSLMTAPAPPPPPPLSPHPGSLFTGALGRFLKATAPMMKTFRASTNAVLGCRSYRLSNEERAFMPADVPDLADLRLFKHVIHLIVAGDSTVRFSVDEMKEIQARVAAIRCTYNKNIEIMDDVVALYTDMKQSSNTDDLVRLSTMCGVACDVGNEAKAAWQALTLCMTELRAKKCSDAPGLHFDRGYGAVVQLEDPLDSPEGFGTGARLDEVGSEITFEKKVDDDVTTGSTACPVWLEDLLSAYEDVEGRKPRHIRDLCLFVSAMTISITPLPYTHTTITSVDNAVRMLGGKQYFCANLKDWFRRFGGDFQCLFREQR